MDCPQSSPETRTANTADTPQGKGHRKHPKRTSDRWKTLNEFVDVTMATLTPRQLKVWLVLFRDVGKNGIARTAQTYIAKRTGLRRPTVSTVISELEVMGLIRVIHAGGLNRGLSQYEVRSAVIR